MVLETCPHRRYSIARSEPKTLGFFDALRRVATQVVATTGSNDDEEMVAAVHEALHRDLEVSTELGRFAEFLAMHSQIVPEDGKAITNVLEIVVTESWMAHESVATYSSIWQVLGNNPLSREVMIGKLSTQYEEARQMLASVFDTRMTDEPTRFIVCQICKVISMMALDVPILREFKTFGDVTPQRVGDILASYNPDRRQREMLQRLTKWSGLSELVAGGVALVDRERASDGAPSTVDEVIAEASRVDLHVWRELTPLLSDTITSETRAQAEDRRRQAFLEWVAPYGRRAAALLHRHQPALNRSLEGLTPEREASEMRHVRVELQQEGKAARERVGYALIKVPEISRYVDNLLECGADALIVVDRNATSGRVETRLGDLLPGEVGLVVLPWQWGGEDRFEAIQRCCKKLPSQGRAIVITHTDALAEIGDKVRSIDVVWAFSTDDEVIASRHEATRGTEALPGRRLYWRERSSEHNILEFFKSVESKAPTKYFYWQPAGAPEQAGPMFAVSVFDEGSEIHLFPLTPLVLARVEAALSSSRHASRIPDDEVAESKLSDILTEWWHFVIKRT